MQHLASPRAVFATRPHPSCCILSYNTRNGALTSICWFVHGRIKEKISTIYAIEYQVYCMENTVQWSANTVQLF